jgi:hypothetical protein
MTTPSEKMTTGQALGNIQVWNFIPDGWEVPLGYDHVVAGAKEALATIKSALKDYEKVKAEMTLLKTVNGELRGEVAAQGTMILAMRGHHPSVDKLKAELGRLTERDGLAKDLVRLARERAADPGASKMTGILDRPRASTARIIANIAVGIALAAILFALVAVIIDEKLSKQVSENAPVSFEQAIPFKGVKP